MTRSQIRTMLRRRVQETTADQWTDSDLNDLINLAYQRVELDILTVNPQAFTSRYQADIVSGQDLYEKPAGFNHELSFKLLDDDGVYKRMDMLSFVTNEARTNESTTKYAHWGAYFHLAPTPSTSVTAGLELDFIPSLSMTDDADVPKIAHPLHMAIVYHAQLLALGETGEEQKRAAEELQILVNKIPLYYQPTGQPSSFEPQIDKGY